MEAGNLLWLQLTFTELEHQNNNFAKVFQLNVLEEKKSYPKEFAVSTFWWHSPTLVQLILSLELDLKAFSSGGF